MAETRVVQPDLEFIRSVRSKGGDTLKKCYQCATCSVVCELSPEDRPFPRKEMIWAGWGQTGRLIADPDIWLCHQCNDCTTHCPRGARPGDVLAAIRSYIYENFSFPRFMGKALASRKALPVLFLVPIVLIIACILLTSPQTPTGEYLFLSSAEIDYNIFMPHSTVDALFVFGNILIFIFAALSFVRFWKMLQADGRPADMSFISAAIATAKEILAHEKFKKCTTNKPRAVAHMILLFGFIGAMITTGLVLLFVFLPHYLHNWFGIAGLDSFFHVPLELPHPVKILGALSGIGLLVGSIMLISRRWGNKDEVGANGYTDYLFLYIIFFTALTGMLAWLLRYPGIPLLAYANYFAHLVFVYFLLWYMPYSKFAHMIYRSLAIIHAKQVGREAR
jgi:quinone-modifying oxidoreductase subunit QmoC